MRDIAHRGESSSGPSLSRSGCSRLTPLGPASNRLVWLPALVVLRGSTDHDDSPRYALLPGDRCLMPRRQTCYCPASLLRCLARCSSRLTARPSDRRQSVSLGCDARNTHRRGLPGSPWRYVCLKIGRPPDGAGPRPRSALSDTPCCQVIGALCPGGITRYCPASLLRCWVAPGRVAGFG
jgi:hypothetical protein